MPLPFTCPHCNHETLVDDKFAGQSGVCVQCNKPIHIPLALTPGSVAPSRLTPVSTGATAAIAIGCGIVLLLVGLVVFCGGGVFFFF